MINWADQERMQFVTERDGPTEAMYFARQCVIVYRKATLASKRKHGRRNVYREMYIQSYLFHKNWLYNCEEFLENKDAV